MTMLSGETHAFCSCYTSRGPVTYQGDVSALAGEIVRLYGAPGTGKSTLISAVAARLLDKGEKVLLLHDPLEPSCFEGAFAPTRGLFIAEAARRAGKEAAPGEIISLDECLNKEKLAAREEGIELVSAEKARHEKRAERFLRAADETVRAAEEIYTHTADDGAMEEMVEALKRLLDAPGTVRRPKRLFAQAATHKGVMFMPHDLFDGEVYTLDAPRLFPVHELLSRVLAAARSGGLPTTEYRDMLHAQRLSHIKCGNVAFTTAKDQHSRVLPFQIAENRTRKFAQELAFSAAARDMLVNQAVESLARARALNCALERMYSECMDYDALDRVRAALLQKLKLK